MSEKKPSNNSSSSSSLESTPGQTDIADHGNDFQARIDLQKNMSTNTHVSKNSSFGSLKQSKVSATNNEMRNMKPRLSIARTDAKSDRRKETSTRESSDMMKRKVSFKPAKSLTQSSKENDTKQKDHIVPKIDEYPLGFGNANGNTRIKPDIVIQKPDSNHSMGSVDSTDGDSSIKNGYDKTNSQDTLRELYDDEIFYIEDMFELNETQDVSGWKEGCCGFLFTAFAITVLISFSCIIVFSVDAITGSIDRSYNTISHLNLSELWVHGNQSKV